MEAARKMKKKRINRQQYEDPRRMARMMGGIILEEKGNPKV